jgi:hypothetical protein
MKENFPIYKSVSVFPELSCKSLQNLEITVGPCIASMLRVASHWAENYSAV